MRGVLAKAWNRLARPRARTLFVYEVACGCGQILRGQRQAYFQTPVCPACGNRVFVLPQSPLPPVAHAGRSALRLGRPPSWRLLAPATALGLMLAIGIAVFLLLPPSRLATKPGPAALLQHWRVGREALHQGKFQIASRELAQAAALQESMPTVLRPTERRALRQARREAELLADLLTASLADVGRGAARLQALDPEEWQAVFDRRYRGRAVLFDAQVWRDANGFQLDRRFDIAGDPGRVNLNDLGVLRHLPFDVPQRLIFGARLTAIRLDRSGIWTFELEPDSGVLLTDPGAARACLPGVDLDQVLERQQAWVAELP